MDNRGKLLNKHDFCMITKVHRLKQHIQYQLTTRKVSIFSPNARMKFDLTLQKMF